MNMDPILRRTLSTWPHVRQKTLVHKEHKLLSFKYCIILLRSFPEHWDQAFCIYSTNDTSQYSLDSPPYKTRFGLFYFPAGFAAKLLAFKPIPRCHLLYYEFRRMQYFFFSKLFLSIIFCFLSSMLIIPTRARSFGLWADVVCKFLSIQQ